MTWGAFGSNIAPKLASIVNSVRRPAMSILVVAAYRCVIAGKPFDDVDYQVRYFDSDSLEEVMVRLRSEKPLSYKNKYGEVVRWVFEDIRAIESKPELQDGKEAIGFIAGERFLPGRAKIKGLAELLWAEQAHPPAPRRTTRRHRKGGVR